MFSLFRRSPVPRDNWYERAQPEELREYNAFGPWISEIQGKEDLPPCFLPWFSPLKHASFLIKIPINRDRREVRPGQNLYRAVFAILEDSIGSLTLDASGQVESRFVPLNEVEALRSFHVLLQAEFGVFLRDGTELLFPYNSVSLPLVERLLDFLSSKLAGKAEETAPKVPESPNASVKDHYFNTLIREHRLRHPGSSVVFCEEPRTKYRESRHLHRSLGLVVLKTSSEWLFLDRGSALQQTHETAYAGSMTWVPFSRGAGFSLVPPDPLQARPGWDFLVRLARHSLVYRLFDDPTRRGLLEALEPAKSP